MHESCTVMAQEYTHLLCMRDRFQNERLTMSIGLERESTGLLYLAQSDQTKPLRRYFAVRMLLCISNVHSEVSFLHHSCLCLRNRASGSSS